MQLLPQARQFAEFMFLEPGLHFALGLHVFLQLLQCGQACFQLRVIRGLGSQLRLGRAALLLQFRLLLLRRLELFARLLQCSLFFFELHFQIGQMRGVRHHHAVFFLRQALAPGSQIGENIRCVALMRGLQFDLLLDLHDLAARFGGLQLRFTPCLFQRRQIVALILSRLLRLFDAHRMLFQAHLGLGQLVLMLLPLALPLVALRGQ